MLKLQYYKGIWYGLKQGHKGTFGFKTSDAWVIADREDMKGCVLYCVNMRIDQAIERFRKEYAPKTFEELFKGTGIKPTTDKEGIKHYNFKAAKKKKRDY